VDTAAVLEGRVRDQVRSKGIDPLPDPESVGKLVDAAVLDSLADASIGDAASLGTSVFHAIAGFGPLQRFFDDPEVEEVWINERLTMC
jgi:pilus assembly protein CpaF